MPSFWLLKCSIYQGIADLWSSTSPPRKLTYSCMCVSNEYLGRRELQLQWSFISFLFAQDSISIVNKLSCSVLSDCSWKPPGMHQKEALRQRFSVEFDFESLSKTLEVQNSWSNKPIVMQNNHSLNQNGTTSNTNIKKAKHSGKGPRSSTELSFPIISGWIFQEKFLFLNTGNQIWILWAYTFVNSVHFLENLLIL